MALGAIQRWVPRRPLKCRTVGHALLIHPKGEPDRHTLRFAEDLAPDSRNTLVVVDLPSDSSLDTEWDAVARLLAGRPGNVRLVFGGGRHHDVRAVGQRIADRLGRAVLAPDGESLPTVGGGLFVPTENGAGWLLFRPGRSAQPDSRRFPKPNWEFSVPDRAWHISDSGVVEPMPSGVWVHSAGGIGPARAHRQRLIQVVPCHPDILAVVVGGPGEPEVRLDDVVRLWERVLPTSRPLVRFVHYGPVELPNGRALGQELADRLEQQVVVYTGLPVTAAPGLTPPEVVGVRTDGLPAWRPYAGELLYSPSHGDRPAPPTLVGLRAPFPDIREMAPGVYEYAPDAVLEIVQSGLWVRPPVLPAEGDDVRSVPARPGHPLVLFDNVPSAADRMRALAKDVLWRLEPAVRDAFLVAPADDPAAAELTKPAAAPQAYPAAAPQPDRGTGRRRSVAAGSLDVMETAAPASPAALPGRRTAPASPAAPSASAAPLALTRTESGGTDQDGATATAPMARVGSPERPAPSEPGPVVESAGPSPQEPAQEPPAGADTSAPGRVVSTAAGAPGVEPSAPEAEDEGADASPPSMSAAVPEPEAAAPPASGPPAGPTGGGPSVLSAEGESSNAESPSGPDGSSAPSTPTGVEDVSPTGPTGGGPSVLSAEGESSNAESPSGPDGSSAPSTPTGAEDVSPTGPTGEGPSVLSADRQSLEAESSPGAGRSSAPSAPASGGAAASADAPAAGDVPPPGGSAVLGPAPEAVPPPDVTDLAVEAETPPTPTQRPAAPRVRLESASPDEPGPAKSAPAIGADSASAPVPPDPAADGTAAPAPDGAPTGAPAEPVPAAPRGTSVPEGILAEAPPEPVRVQPVPKPGACAVPPEDGLGKERAWVRRALSEQYNAAVGTVSGVMAESPALRGGSRGTDEEALTDLIALRLYLTGDSRGLDAAVRGATAGPHVPLARCVASGLRRLPSYRGPALLHSALAPGERAWYREGKLVTEWAFCAAHTGPSTGPEGATDILIWSMTARRTNLLDPSDPDRVIFLPGTSFMVLKTVTGDGGRPAVLLRELSQSDISADGRVVVQRTPLDEIAVNSLEQTLQTLAESAGARTKNSAKGTAHRTAAPPGLLTAGASRRRGASRQAATRKATTP